MNVDELWGKARQAANASVAACRGYLGRVQPGVYAMFDVARAALLTSGAHASSEIAKTHSGLIHAFSQHLVKTALVPKELGESLARAHELRLVAAIIPAAAPPARRWEYRGWTG